MDFLCMYRTRLVAVTLVLFLSNVLAFAQETWIERKKSNGITVFSKKRPNDKYQELRVETIVDGKVSQVLAAVTDVNHHDDWVYKALNTKIIRKLKPGEFYYYTQIDAPWPFENRDLVLHMKVEYDAASGVAIIHTNNIDNILEPVPEVVRLTYSRGHWTFTPQAGNKVKIEYEILVDTGIGLPSWLINMFVATAPYETFKNLKTWMKAPKYVNARIPLLQ